MHSKLGAWAPLLVSAGCVIAIVAFKRSERDAAAKQAEPAALAWVGDVPITAADVERRAALLRSGEWAAREPVDGRQSPSPSAEPASVLEYLLDEEVVFREAHERGLDRDEFVRRHATNRLMEEEVLARAAARSDDPAALRAWFDAHAAEFGGRPLEDVREAARAKFVEAETDRLTREFVAKLREKWSVRYAPRRPATEAKTP
jgi:hypothetical protein